MQPWQSLESWLVMLQTNSGKLARIEFLVVFTAIILLLTFILDSYRYRTRSKFVRYVLIFLDTVADSIATYTLGLMQVVPFENELFQVWAVLLITLKDSTRYISGYSLHEKENRRRKEIRDLLDSFFLANLTATRGSRFKVPLWLLWGLNQLKIFHSIMAFDMAERSYAHGRNTRLVAGYMQYEHKLSELTEADERSVMSGFRYLVHGEAKQKVVPRLPHYQMELRTIQEEKLITIDKVWQCQGRLLNNSSRKKSHQESIVEGRKDICLSFALYKLLRRRFEGLDDYLCDEEREKSKKMISQLLLKEKKEKNAERLFRIIRKELAFVNDYLYTRFPVVFATGIPYVYFLYFAISGVGCWLAAELLIGYKPKESELNHVKHGYNIDVIITFVVIILIRVKEFWEMATYLFSDWNKVLMLCTYVERASWQKSRVAEKLLGFLCNHTLITHWHDRIGQYQILESFNHRPRMQNLLSYATLGMIPRGGDGAKEQSAARLTGEAKDAIVASLRRMLSASGDAPCLTGGITALEANESSHLRWTCDLPTHAHTILVWHIATALCEIHLSRRLPWFIITKSKLSWYRRCLVSFRSFLFPRGSRNYELEKELRSRCKVASCLSQYCGYLLVFIPDFLPDHCFTTEYIYEETVKKAREVLGECKNMQEMYETLMNMQSAKEPGTGDSMETIIHDGARLAYELIAGCDQKDKDVEDPTSASGSKSTSDPEKIQVELKRWKILEEFWTEFILYLAPSYNTCAHSEHLNKGGEFMTHLWALLYHAGIVEPPLKPVADQQELVHGPQPATTAGKDDDDEMPHV